MNSDRRSREQKLQDWEAQLRERELKIRMRELESEVEVSAKGPLKAKRKPAARDGWHRRLPVLAKFGLLVLGAFVVVRVAAWLAGVLLFLGIIWVGYKLFLERS